MSILRPFCRYLASENYRMMLLLRSQHLHKCTSYGTRPARDCHINHVDLRLWQLQFFKCKLERKWLR